MNDKKKSRSIVSLIPARGGSKGIPKKNIKKLKGKPLISYSIEESLKSRLITRTIVSTDDKVIAKVALKSGAEVPFRRPDKLAEDHVLDFPVIKHALEYLIREENIKPEIIVFLRPTMPIRSYKEIDKVINLLIKDEGADCIRTSRPAIYPPYWMKRINKNNYLEPYHDHVAPYTISRRQDLPKVVMCDGYVDVARVKSVLEQNIFPPRKQITYYRENVPYIDLDSEEDWHYCEYYFNNKLKFS
mgnify:CR=1 FL=1